MATPLAAGASVAGGVPALLPGARAQIVDDSTKNRYGARTTFILREADMMRGDTVGRIIDTTLTRLPQRRYWVHDSAFYQDLGNFGTASRHLLLQPNTEIGARLGRNVFDRYVRNPSTIAYYDTRSPYTFFRFHQGNPFEQIFELGYTRSLKKDLNVGFAYERFGSNKALAVTNTRAGQVEHTNFLLFVRYQTPDDRYHLMANFTTARHRAIEQGGIAPLASDTIEGSDGKVDLTQLFDYQREEVRLSGASNRDDRDQVHLAHTYRLLGRGLTAYHMADWTRRQNKYFDDQLINTTTGEFRYDVRRLSNTITDDRADFRQVENTLGVMGNSPAVAYRLYGKHRTYSLESRSRVGSNTVTVEKLNYKMGVNTQYFLGGTASFRYKEFAIETSGEVKVPEQFKELIHITKTEYILRGATSFGPVQVDALLTSYSPTLTEQRFVGNHAIWENTGFSNTQVQQVRGVVNRAFGNQHLQLVGALANITNLVYYNEQAVPAQLGSGRQVYSLTAQHKFNVGHLFFDNLATYTEVTGGTEGLRFPRLVGESRLYYQGYVFKKALFGQFGVQTYFQSRWKPYDYSPSTQQFFFQDHFTVRNTPIADVFVSADIKTVSVFFKMAYVNQFLPQSGYFTTPYYTGLPRRLQFGIRWQFFN
ncbi:putative porin [Hymenobacter sp. 5414T-23]|uniref:putative porin n=1 Tax=Hymenobacter sp. 5414T-23 TaxID=2932252 RepID=UPI001FCFFABB|nr:putative porin [Hymenobacter sp. 5414T-23]UOQ81708.1 putative porin [Hymenobacter sp. 5414T-23]